MDPVRRVLCDACSGSEKSAALPTPAKVGDMMAFLATDRPMGTLSAMRDVLDAPQAGALWHDEKYRMLIAGEWRALKALMKEAGFE